MKELQVENSLKAYILLKRLNALNTGKDLKISEIEKDLSEYCSISREMIAAIKAQKKTPSLAVALRIAEYFGEDVSSIFRLKKEKQETQKVIPDLEELIEKDFDEKDDELP